MSKNTNRERDSRNAPSPSARIYDTGCREGNGPSTADIRTGVAPTNNELVVPAISNRLSHLSTHPSSVNVNPAVRHIASLPIIHQPGGVESDDDSSIADDTQESNSFHNSQISTPGGQCYEMVACPGVPQQGPHSMVPYVDQQHNTSYYCNMTSHRPMTGAPAMGQQLQPMWPLHQHAVPNGFGSWNSQFPYQAQTCNQNATSATANSISNEGNEGANGFQQSPTVQLSNITMSAQMPSRQAQRNFPSASEPAAAASLENQSSTSFPASAAHPVNMVQNWNQAHQINQNASMLGASHAQAMMPNPGVPHSYYPFSNDSTIYVAQPGNMLAVPPQSSLYQTQQNNSYAVAPSQGIPSTSTNQTSQGLSADNRRSPIDSNSNWVRRYQELIAYKNANGHCNVPQRCKVHGRLGRWVKDHRTFKRTGKLRENRRRLLDEIGFTWDMRKGK